MFKILKNLRKREILFILISAALIVTQVLLELKMPDYMSEITVLVQTEGSKMSEILKNGGYMILCAFSSFLTSFLVGYLLAQVAATFSLVTRKKLFTKIKSLSTEEIKKFSL